MSFFSFGYRLLNAMPVWLLVPTLSFLFIGILFPIRNHWEKIEYNHAWSSEIGDVFLIGWILIGWTVIQRRGPGLGAIAPKYTVTLFVLWLIVSVVDWVITFIQRRRITVADAYHNVFVVSAMCYFLGATLLVIFAYGETVEKSAMGCFFFVWLGCFIFDAKTGRLEQNKYQARKGMVWRKV